MITLITGQPGNGKSLMAMSLMAAEYERNAAAVKAGKEQPRRFFSNVAGATTEENPDAFPWVEAMPGHNDWTKLPNGSFVQYDEAHADGKTPGLERYGSLFPATGKPGESDDLRIRSMSTHRHRGFDIQLLTQWPNKIHHQVRTLVGEHVHMARAFGMERAGVLKWTRVQTDPYDEDQREKAEETIWPYPKAMYPRYISSQVHTASHKFKVPKAVWSGLSVLVVTGLVLWGFVSWANNKSSKQVAEIKAGAQAGERAAPPAPGHSAAKDYRSTNPGTGHYEALAAPRLVRIAGFIDSPRGCRVWSVEGEQLDIPQRDCRDLVDKGMPVHFAIDARGSRAGKQEERDAGTLPSVTAATGVGGSFGDVASYGGMGVGNAHGDAPASSIADPL